MIITRPNDGDTFWESTLLSDFIVVQHHRAHSHKPRWYIYLHIHFLKYRKPNIPAPLLNTNNFPYLICNANIGFLYMLHYNLKQPLSYMWSIID